MKIRKVILYLRVSTDEQAEKGYSLRHQEEKLRHHCTAHNMDIVAVYIEDYSAKTFDRPEFKRMMDYLRKNKGAADLLLFLKWDRFSRNAPEAYSMIARLHRLGIEPQAMEQPLNFEIPEQKFMLAFYLTAPEVENDRRALNTASGMRKALKEGRYMGSAPKGYKHGRDENNRPCIIPGKDAHLVVMAFEKMATGNYHIEVLRREMNRKGLKVSRAAFWCMLRHPVYIGRVVVPAYKDEPEMLVPAQHPPLISETQFYIVQDVLKGKKRKDLPANHSKQEELPLRGYLMCPKCGKNLTGSASRGSGGKYYYYHCRDGCKVRFRASTANDTFLNTLQKVSSNQKVLRSLELIIENQYDKHKGHRTAELQQVKKELEMYRSRLQKAQELVLDGELDAADYRMMKEKLGREIMELTVKETALGDKGKDMKEMVKFGFYFLKNIDKLFVAASLERKAKILSSTFPEKLVFENGECRTKEEVNIILLMSALEEGFNINEEGQLVKSSRPSCQVAPPRIELGSKV